MEVLKCHPLGFGGWLGDGRKEGKKKGVEEKILLFAEHAIFISLGDV